MIEVEGPDGTVVEFPDGTDNATITGVMRKQFGGPQETSTGQDVAQSFGSGLVRGAAEFAMLPVTAGRFLQRQIDRAGEAVGIVTPETKALLEQASPVTQALTGIQDSARQTMDATLHKPETTVGEYARTVGEFAPGLLGGGTSLAGRAVTQVAAPAIGSETAGQLTKGTDLEPWARFLGGIAGGVTAAAGSRAITPAPSSPAREAMVNTLAKEGVEVTAGQRTGSRNLQAIESELGGSAGANFMERQAEQFTQAALKRAGINAPRATPEVIDAAFTAVGQKFADLSARNQLLVDNKLSKQLADSLQEYGKKVAASRQSPVVSETLNDIVTAASTAANNGQGIPGAFYQSLRSDLTKDVQALKMSDPSLSQALRKVRDALDDGMERSIYRTNRQDMGAWREARREYANLSVIEDAVSRAGAQAAEGLITPQALRAAAAKGNKRNYARGKGDFNELARAGTVVMKPLADSGTSVRTRAQNLGTTLASVAGAGVGGHIAGGPGYVAGALAGAAIPWAVGRGALSNLGRQYLGNQVLQNQAAPLSLEDLTRNLVTLPTTTRERR
ncbi:hypothetical protein GCM10007276_12330 [Agaricicola taiwanensis]|uniref:Uncharacterized protein n=1 Tax=Agaricicola taiwanensis TaxID=591372 RepID=A0A8J2VPA1_9RHOB|nr:hypothetical protein [Agaricicola taiwanensis]GGE36382.1 hypothetical protein GCM10007276_12330 [Agaricicola taiwanensis]